MKTLRNLLVVVLSVCFLISLVSIAWSVTAVKPAVPTEPKQLGTIPDLFACPAGWHVKAGSWVKASITTCVPDIPKPIKCPSGTQYFDNVEKGCFVGCTPIIK